MLKTRLVLPFFIFLFLFLAKSTYAYQSFNNNPFLTNSYNGFLVEDFNSYATSCQCNWLGVNWCGFLTCTNQSLGLTASYSSASPLLSADSNGKLILTNIHVDSADYSNETLRIIPLNAPYFFQTDNTTTALQYEDNYGWITIPKGNEVIVNLQMRVNGTSGINVDGVNSPVIIVYQVPYSYGTNYVGQWIFQRNTSSETVIAPITTQILSYNGSYIGVDSTVNNYTFILPSNIAEDRVLQFALSLRWNTFTPNTTIEISKFNIYTLDISTTENYWQNDATTMLHLFCGNNSALSSLSGVYIYPFLIRDSSRIWLWAYDKSINYNYALNRPDQQSGCGVFKIGDLTIGGRFILYCGSADANGTNFISASCGFDINKKLLFYYSIGSPEGFSNQPTQAVNLFESLGTSNAKITTFYNNTNAQYDASYYYFDLDIVDFLGYPVNTNFSIPNISYNYPDAISQTINFTSYLSNGIPQSTKFRVLNTFSHKNSSYLDIFSAIQNCPTQYVCTGNTQYQQHIDANGTCILTNATYCGDAGCLGNICKSINLITYCTGTSSYQTDNADGTSALDICPNASICINLTNANGIKCLSTNNTVILCIDNSGAITDCVGVENPETSTSISKNPMNAIALAIGGIFGYGSTASLSTAQTVSALLISLFTSLCIVLLIITKASQSINGNNMLFTFSLTFLALLIMFTMISWFPSWLMIVLIIVSAVAFIKIGGIGQSG